ncbi:MAG: D-alanine--D-alanine ligase [Paludibacteraceae bacterium]|nr:D-alanine--D-alanine ligase [Paludibacteraceae bacterium]
MNKRKIAIVAGGDSSEHDVSLRSAAGILSFLDKERYEAEIIELKGADRHALQRITEFDFAYITIHGTPGENGLLQGYLEMMHIPYSCCNVLAAALTFNKYACNHYLQGFGVRISPSILLRKNDWCCLEQSKKEERAQQIIQEIGLPCFIKSNVGGSSFGCTKVKHIDQALPAIETAFKEGDEVICETFMAGTEITCGVYKTATKAVAFPITEVVTGNEFFDYNAKYNGEVQEITPARIPDEVRDRVQAETLRIYDIIGAQGIIRVDYILTKDDAQCTGDNVQINLLEVNTTPGMTATSFIPQQVRAAGLDIKDVLTDIIENKFRK